MMMLMLELSVFLKTNKPDDTLCNNCVGIIQLTQSHPQSQSPFNHTILDYLEPGLAKTICVYIRLWTGNNHGLDGGESRLTRKGKPHSQNTHSHPSLTHRILQSDNNLRLLD